MNLASKLINSLKNYQIEKSFVSAHALHRQAHSEEYKLIDEIVRKFRETGGLKFEHQAYKLWALQKLLRTYQPKSILEFGSGSSSLVISDFVRNNEATFLSIDEDSKWATNTSRLIDIREGEPIEIRHCRKIVLPNSKPIEIRYDVELSDTYDFVLIDGPSLNVESKKLKEAINSNFTDLKSLPKVILVDVRKATANYIAEQFQDKYDARLSDIFDLKPVEPGYQYFSIFVKK